MDPQYIHTSVSNSTARTLHIINSRRLMILNVCSDEA